MKMNRVLLAAAAIGLAALSLAQPGGGMRRMGGGGGLMPVTFVIGRQDVQDDLKLTTDQKTKLETLRDENRTQMRALFTPGQPPSEETQKAMQKLMEEQTTKLNAILTPEQAKRLQEIRIQMAGNRAVLDKDVAKTLGITADQTAKLKALQTKMDEANRQIFEKAQSGDIERSQIRELMQKNNEVMKTEIDKVLTEEQKTKLKDLSGAPFVQKDEPGRGFGGGGFGGGR